MTLSKISTEKTDLLESGHPGLGEMAVLEEDPGAVPDAVLHHLHGDRTLPLPQRQRLQLGTAETLQRPHTGMRHYTGKYTPHSHYTHTGHIRRTD